MDDLKLQFRFWVCMHGVDMAEPCDACHTEGMRRVALERSAAQKLAEEKSNGE